MRTALCIYGQPRFLNNQNVKNRLDQFLYNQSDVDVYIHTWNVDICVGSEWNPNNSMVDDMYKKINDTYKPKRFLIDLPMTSYNIDSETYEKLKYKSYYTERNLISLASHLYSFQTSLSLIEDEYDFVFVTRFDNLIKKFPDLQTLKPKHIYYTDHYNGHFSDASFIISWDIINEIKPYTNLRTRLMNCDVMTSENVKRLEFSKYVIEPINLVCPIVRSDVDEIGIL